jgi:crotonobetainyl-CoA:carnitine CoA-transferase CaiB-like acyl-CoA transferase
MPVAPGLGRYFVPLNRGKRSVVLDLKTEEGRRSSARLLRSADAVLHNFRPSRAPAFGLDWESVHSEHPSLVVGFVSSFGGAGPLAGAAAYDLVAQARAGLLTAHASPGDRVPVRAGGIPMADLTAGLLLAAGVLAALVRARESGVGERVEVSLLAAAMAVQLQDLVWLPGEDEDEDVRAADRAHLEARAAEIAGGVAMNPYYRCFETADGFVAVACLNVTQRRALLALLGLADPTVDAPDLVPDDPAVLAAKEELTTEIERAFGHEPTSDWLARLEAAGVPCGIVQAREAVYADPQVSAAGLVGDVEQPGLGRLRLLAPFVRVGEVAAVLAPAPALGADTDAVLAELP